jgi:hypothetical protein
MKLTLSERSNAGFLRLMRQAFLLRMATRKTSPLSPEPLLLRTGRFQLDPFVKIIRDLDVMTLLMVAGTFFAAIAAWRSSQVSQQILRTAYRPYVGVREVTLDLANRSKPEVVIQISNFGGIPAEQMILAVAKTLDGQAIADLEGTPSVTLSVGTLSPQAPDYFGSFLSVKFLKPILDGRSQLHVNVHITYRDFANNRYCYDETFGFFAPTGRLSPIYGTSSCPSESPP